MSSDSRAAIASSAAISRSRPMSGVSGSGMGGGFGARAALIVGEDELARGAAALRDMASKRQEEIPLGELESVLTARREI